MSDFMSMMGSYEQRKVANYDKDGLVVDTCSVTDSDKMFETAVCHSNYNEGNWVIVEKYDTKCEALDGHNKWVKTMTTMPLPKKLVDVGAGWAGVMLAAMGDNEFPYTG